MIRIFGIDVPTMDYEPMKLYCEECASWKMIGVLSGGYAAQPCSSCPERERTMKQEPTNTYETLKLSAIYQQLLNSLEQEIDKPQGYFKARTHQQQIQLISDAVGQALQLLSARCSRCDAECLPLCPACIVAAQQSASKLSIEEDHTESW